MNSRAASETAPSATPFQLFTSSSRLGSTVGVEGRVGLRVSRRVRVEVAGSYLRPELSTAIANDFAVQVAMTNALALSVGYGVRYNSNPPAGSKNTDQLTTVNLVYNFNRPTTK